MIYTELTKKALKVSFETHKNQTDKSGMPYVYHPFHLAEQMDDEYSTCVALMHDVVEDSNFTLDDLINEGFPKEVTDAIALMTHDKNVLYMDYVAKIKMDPIARKVKIADLRHNSDLSRLNVVDDKALDRVNKYQKAISILNTIEKLEITAGVGSILRNIILTKDSITFYYTNSPGMMEYEFPAGFFDIKNIQITDNEYIELTDRIIKYGLFSIKEYVNSNIPSRAIPHHLMYELFDGTAFRWKDYVTPPAALTKISALLDYFCDHRKILTDEEIYEKVTSQRIVRPMKTIVGFSLPCCNIKVPKSYHYCPKCGKEINEAEECEFEYDIDKTIIFCENCGKDRQYEYPYCGFCGKKSRCWE